MHARERHARNSVTRAFAGRIIKGEIGIRESRPLFFLKDASLENRGKRRKSGATLARKAGDKIGEQLPRFPVALEKKERR